MTPPRDTVPVERTWDEPGVFSTVEAWEAELEAVLADLPALAAFQGRAKAPGLHDPFPARPDDPDERFAITQNGGSRLSTGSGHPLAPLYIGNAYA